MSVKYFKFDGRPKFILGINYQSAEFGHLPELWEDESCEEIVDRDFRHLKELGVVAVRIQSAKFHRDKTFSTILKFARKYGLYLVPNFGLGDLMQGDRWFYAQGSGILKLEGEGGTKFKHEQEDPFVEPSVSRQEAYIRAVLGRYRDEDMILAWDICNEPSYALYGGSSLKYAQYCGKDSRTAREVTTLWAKRLYRAAKEADPDRPITVGVDHSVVVMDTGFDIVGFSEANDLMSTHVYSRNVAGYIMVDGACSLRDTYVTPFVIRFSQITGRPVAPGECGNNSYVMSEELQGRCYRVMLYSSLVNGAVGVFPWCFHEYDLSSPKLRSTYDGGPSEAEFGIVRPDHTEKPAALELKKFGEVVDRIDFSKFRPAEPDVGILVPESYYDFLYEHRASLFNAFVLAKEAHLNVSMVRAGGLKDLRMLVVPTTHLKVSEMEGIREFVEAGGYVLLSVTDALGGRISYLRDVVGFVVEDYIPGPPEVEFTFLEDFGVVNKGSRMRYFSDTWTYYVSHEKPENERQYFSVLRPTTAQVLAVDGEGRPCVLWNRYGRGGVLCFAFGVEYYLSNMPDVYLRDRTYEIYRSLALEAGVPFPVDCDDPFVEVGRLVAEGEELVFLINHERRQMDFVVRFEGEPRRVRNFVTGEVVLEGGSSSADRLEENGVKVYLVSL